MNDGILNDLDNKNTRETLRIMGTIRWSWLKQMKSYNFNIQTKFMASGDVIGKVAKMYQTEENSINKKILKQTNINVYRAVLYRRGVYNGCQIVRGNEIFENSKITRSKYARKQLKVLGWDPYCTYCQQ